MDHSRIVRATYLHYLQGGVPPISGAQRIGQRNVRSCASWQPALTSQAELWQNQSPSGAFARASRFLNDIEALSTSTDIQSSIIFYGIGQPELQCTQEVARRAALMSSIDKNLASHSITMWDAEAYIADELSADQSALDLRGFGSRLGTGHLNHVGHQAYSRLLISVVSKLIEAR